uniref:Uncharacterized protein n=1 Tax=Opuntia streptacantha TaxID=393608 RepID=A0A7C8ZXG6_OPUST
MPSLVKYEQTGSYFSWLSKQLKNPLFPRCVRPLHALHSTATLSETRPHHSSLFPKPHISRHHLHAFLSPQINCCFLIEPTACKTETSSHGALQELQHVHFQLVFLQSNWIIFFVIGTDLV